MRAVADTNEMISAKETYCSELPIACLAASTSVCHTLLVCVLTINTELKRAEKRTRPTDGHRAATSKSDGRSAPRRCSLLFACVPDPCNRGKDGKECGSVGKHSCVGELLERVGLRDRPDRKEWEGVGESALSLVRGSVARDCQNRETYSIMQLLPQPVTQFGSRVTTEMAGASPTDSSSWERQ